jgi:hypothetical protein
MDSIVDGIAKNGIVHSVRNVGTLRSSPHPLSAKRSLGRRSDIQNNDIRVAARLRLQNTINLVSQANAKGSILISVWCVADVAPCVLPSRFVGRVRELSVLRTDSPGFQARRRDAASCQMIRIDVVESAGALTHGRASFVGPQQMQADTLLVGPAVSAVAWGASGSLGCVFGA